jgi:hypothetical protein
MDKMEKEMVLVLVAQLEKKVQGQIMLVILAEPDI